MMPMPRVLFIVDEFQELFVEDDKLAQDAGLLLDRLVRQGRAFGIHVLLGSQTLSGAYSLARSTMGQMAVRVALQCSEADAHLILSDERNEAARFLSRPGEAIYNDQNGLLAGNHPFQVVWLPESQRVDYLRQVEEKSKAQGVAPRGDDRLRRRSGGRSGENLQLREMLGNVAERRDGCARKGVDRRGRGDQGADVRELRPTRGQQLLVVGAWEESALGVLTNAVIALAAQNSGVASESSLRVRSRRPGSLQFYVLDGTRPESPEAGTWQRIADALPHRIEVVGMRDTARVINEIATELARREAAGEEDAPPIYLVIFNGGRFRDLRRGEDDFSFSSDRDKPPSPDKQWAEILRNGPAWGIHTLLWCDSYNNVNRMLDRMALREFEMRVAFQMSAADSASFLDNPAATKLAPTPRPVRERRPRHDGKIPAVWDSDGRVAGGSAEGYHERIGSQRVSSPAADRSSASVLRSLNCSSTRRKIRAQLAGVVLDVADVDEVHFAAGDFVPGEAGRAGERFFCFAGERFVASFAGKTGYR